MRTVRNGERFARNALTWAPVAAFRDEVVGAVNGGARLGALVGIPDGAGDVRLVVALVDGEAGAVRLAGTVVNGEYDALTPECPAAHLFERELAEQTGLVPRGHPWLKPVRFTRPGAVPGVTEFYRVAGAEVHEVAVGPVHAGIIEPGHFRFQCHGEEVLHLEIALGYQHRGIERALRGGPDKRTIHYLETVAGDTTIGHAWAYSQAVESLAGTRVPARAQALRGVALELERLANHTGDLGALAGDVGYLPTASFCGRLRGDFLNLTALIGGNRFGRGVVRPGGTGFDVDDALAGQIRERLDQVLRDVAGAVNLLWDTSSVRSRFENTGVVSPTSARALGLVGPAARACGLERDVRLELPTGIYQFCQIPVSTWHTGDVFARAYVRWVEIQRSAAFVREQLAALPAGEVRVPVGPLAADAAVVSLVEGWRGEICHVALTDAAGRFATYKVVDPSFHNWAGLALAMRGQPVSDFPLCNKSFNLSYCGHDL